MSWVALGAATISAGGAIGGGLLTKKQKAPQIPHVTLPGPGDYEDYPFIEKEIRRLESQPGFGQDFVDKAHSPIAQSMRRNFQQFTSPTISSEYSKRGLGRSSIAANEIGRAEGDVESGIGDLFSQLFQLNEIQKSNQGTAGLAARERKLGRAVERQTGQAAIDIGLPGQQFALDQSARQETATNRAGNAQLGLSLASLFGGGGQGGEVSSILSQLTQPQGVKTNLLGSSDNELAEIYRMLQGAR